MSVSIPKAKPKIRNAKTEDFDKVYPLLQAMGNKRLSRGDWFCLFQDHWSLEEFSPGIVLELDNEIVGYLGTIYSKQVVCGEYQVFCNLTSWIVQDEYRSHSIMMILPLVRKKNIVLTSFSSNKVTYEVYKKLGFKNGNQDTRIIYPLPSFRQKKYTLMTDIRDINDNCNQQNKIIFNDHKTFNNAYALIKYKDEECLLMGVSREKLLKVYYVSNKGFLQKHIKYFRNNLMKKFEAKRMHIDEQLLNGVSIFLSRKVTWGRPYQFKSYLDTLESPTPVYSEMFLLDM